MATADPALLDARVRAAELTLAAHYGRTLAERIVHTPGGTEVRVVEYPAVDANATAAALPPVLLLHGVAAVTAVALPLLASLADRRILAIDWPGHGLSGIDVVPKGAEVRSHEVAVLDAVLAAFELERVDMIGHSLGGQIALYFALAHPDRLRRLVLLGAPGAAFAQARPTFGMRVVATPGLGTAVLGLSTSQGAHDRAVDRLLGAGAMAGYPAEISEVGYLASQRSQFASSVASLFRAMMTPLGARNGIALTAEELAHLSVPTLIVWGTDDAILPPAKGRASAGALPNATILEVDGGHAPWLDQPEQVGHAVSTFLGEQS
ncbi:MAG TPA: alpha/beta hydrolase [Pseudolysinimonas sp.]|jgi:pimeloyl-ACP methyl ester carboxylesterase